MRAIGDNRRQRRHQHHCFKNLCASSVSIAWRNWTYSEEICNKVSVYRVNIVLKSWKSVCTEKDGHAASEAVTVAWRRAGVGSGSGVGCGSDLSSERTWTRYAWYACHIILDKMAGVSSEDTRKRWTAVVLTCQNKTSAHTFQKGK